MIGLDTNVLARYFVEEDGADAATQDQRQAARQLIESGQDLFLPKTVALELEWVLRGYYGFAAEQVLQVFEQLLRHPCLQLDDRPGLEQAVEGLRSGLDFADAASRQLPRLRCHRLLRRPRLRPPHPPAQPAATGCDSQRTLRPTQAMGHERLQLRRVSGLVLRRTPPPGTRSRRCCRRAPGCGLADVRCPPRRRSGHRGCLPVV
ncbi:MAG: hypothetical protein RLZZ11_645 [Cyanobacteriota bacterium]